MLWNWQQKKWPDFTYDKSALAEYEAKFLHQSGILVGTYRHVKEKDKNELTVDLMSDEALKTSEIEGEYLNRSSLRSSIGQHFGLATDNMKISPAERGIAEMMMSLYQDFSQPLATETLFAWHTMLMNGRRDIADIGQYRTHAEAMQVISGPIGKTKVHFEAPPSRDIPKEMNRFIVWFNQSHPQGEHPLPGLTRAGIAHLYYVSIHPFEDGNGRIARALSEKVLSQAVGHPTLVALSHTIGNNKKAYYDMLASSNKNCEITEWLIYFTGTVLTAQEHTQKTIDFLIEKTKLYDRLNGRMNERQNKILACMFHEGIDGFKGGLSAEKYISITGASRATATRDLQEMVQIGALIRTGERKYTRYWINIGREEKAE
jgi:Fic family protein